MCCNEHHGNASDGDLASLLTQTGSHMRVRDVVMAAGNVIQENLAAGGEEDDGEDVDDDGAMLVVTRGEGELGGGLSELSRDENSTAGQENGARTENCATPIDRHQTEAAGEEKGDDVRESREEGEVLRMDGWGGDADGQNQSPDHLCFEEGMSDAHQVSATISSVEGVDITTAQEREERIEAAKLAGHAVLELNGYDIRIRLTLEDMLQPATNTSAGRVHGARWLMSMLTSLREDKLLWDASELGSGKIQSRLPVFAHKWFVRKFGKNKFCEQQMVDLMCTLNAHEATSVEARMFCYSFRERFNAGQLTLFLSMRSFAAAVASKPKSDARGARGAVGRGEPMLTEFYEVPLAFAKRIANFALDFAQPRRLAKVHARLVNKSYAQGSQQTSSKPADSITARNTTPCTVIALRDVLNVVLSGYGSAIHEFRVALREEYEDLLHELARGMPRDGCNQRPFGFKVGLRTMCEFVAKHYKRDASVFKAFFDRLRVREEEEEKTLTTSTASVSSSTSSQVPAGSGSPEPEPWVDLDCVIAIDDAVDLLGFDKRWDRLNQTDVCMVISQDRSPSHAHRHLYTHANTHTHAHQSRTQQTYAHTQESVKCIRETIGHLVFLFQMLYRLPRARACARARAHTHTHTLLLPSAPSNEAVCHHCC